MIICFETPPTTSSSSSSSINSSYSTTTSTYGKDNHHSIDIKTTMTRTLLLNSQQQQRRRRQQQQENEQEQDQSFERKSIIHILLSWLCSFLHLFCLDIPVLILFIMFIMMLFMKQFHNTTWTPYLLSFQLQSSYNDNDHDDDRNNNKSELYDQFHNDFTYYHRQCYNRNELIHVSSIDELLITNDDNININDTGDKNKDDKNHHHHHDTSSSSSSSSISSQAAHKMLRYGAITIQNLLSNTTAITLRNYLSQLHERKETLPYEEVFFNSMDRWSLGLGIADHSIIGQALREVGTNHMLQQSLYGIVGDDPMIIEISTLTSLNNAEEQDLHTDSDFFGSSLLYGQTFLHSYSLFIALQDTTKQLGATTVCPGSHYCANDDLEELCFNHNDHDDDDDHDDDHDKIAFEISTNGKMGNDGLLYRGDGFLFNQNVWHRGPTNQDIHGRDRIMFIITFASQRKTTTTTTTTKTNYHHHHDVRRQGLGTYYYQRWNMWGHTFNDLRYAGETTFLQPISALNALGIWKDTTTTTTTTNQEQQNQQWGGITYWEQVAQQMSNDEDFYSSDELYEFHELVLNKYKIPKWLYAGESIEQGWIIFIQDTIHIWYTLSLQIYIIALFLYINIIILVLYFFIRNKSQQQQRRRRIIFAWKTSTRLFKWHLYISCIILLIYHFSIGNSTIAQSVRNGQIGKTPFPNTTTTTTATANTKTITTITRSRSSRSSTTVPTIHWGPTTFPETCDVLLGTRLNDDYLASYKMFLDYHPGNQKWLHWIQQKIILSLQQHHTKLSISLLQRLVMDTWDDDHDDKNNNDNHDDNDNIITSPTTTEGGRQSGSDGEGGRSCYYRRLLRQHPTTGAWHVLSQDDEIKETLRHIAYYQSQELHNLAKEVQKQWVHALWGRTALSRIHVMTTDWAFPWLDRIIIGLLNDNDDDDDNNNNNKQEPWWWWWYTNHYGSTITTTTTSSNNKNNTDVSTATTTRAFHSPFHNSHIRHTPGILPTSTMARNTKSSSIPHSQSLVWNNNNNNGDHEEDEEKDDDQRRRRRRLQQQQKQPSFQVGDMVWMEDEDVLLKHKITKIVQPDLSYHLIDLITEDEIIIDHDDAMWMLRPYIPLQEGDEVQVDYHEDGTLYVDGVIRNIHPSGSCSVQLFEGGEIIPSIQLHPYVVPLLGRDN